MPSRTKLPQFRQAAEPEELDPSVGEPTEAARQILVGLLKGEITFGKLLGLGAEDLGRLIELGRGHLALGQAPEARRIFEGLTALEPEVAVGHQLLAMACEADEAHEEAQQAYTRAIHLMADGADPGLCSAYLGRGTLRLRLGDLAGALTDLALAREHSEGQDPLIVQSVEVLEQSCAAQAAGAAGEGA